MQMNSSIVANPGKKMSPLETGKSSKLRSLFAAYMAKYCELTPFWNEQGEVERKREAHEISERAQQEEFLAIRMEETKMMNMALLAWNP